MDYYSYSHNTGMQYHESSAAAKQVADKAMRTFVHNGITDVDVLGSITWGEVAERAVAGAVPMLRRQARIDYEAQHPQVVDGRMENGNGDLVLVRNIHETDLMYHELVLTIALIWKSLSGKIQRFKQYNFEEVSTVLALLFEKYSTARGGRDGNMTFFTIDRKFKLTIAIQKKLDFGPELQVAAAKLRAAVDEMDADDDIRTIVTGLLNLEEDGKLRVSKVLELRKFKFANAQWNEGMRIIDDAIMVISSKKMMRLHERNDQGEYNAIPLDIAAL